MMIDFAYHDLKDAFLEGIEFQIHNEGGTDIEGWRDHFDRWFAEKFERKEEDGTVS